MKQKLLNLFRLRAFALIAILCAGVSAAWGAEFTYSFSSGGTFDGGDNPTATWTTDYFTILQEKNTSTSPVANYLTTPRWYKNHNVTITPVANCTITNIVINCSKDYTGQDITASTGNVSKDGNNSTWTGSITNETPLVLTMGAQCRPTSLVVTYEFAGTIPPSISVVVDAVELEYNDKEGEIAYTIENPVSGTSLSATTEADWISNINVTSDKVTFMTTQNDGDVARTADITLSYAGATSKVVSVTQKYNVPDFAKLPFNWEGGASSDLLRLAGVTANGLGSDYAANNAPYIVKFDTTDDYIQIKTNGQPGKVTIGVKMLGGGNTSTITVQGSADGEAFTDVQALTISGNQNKELTLEAVNPFAANVRYVRLLFTKGSNVGVGPISIAQPSNDPQISAENLSIEYDVTSGTISCEIINPVEGGVVTATTDASWLTFGEKGVAFTTTANEAVEARTANVTITYTYNSNQTITKAVTVTQTGDPNASGTQNNPYTVAQAIAATPESGTSEKVYIHGIVSAFFGDDIMSDGSNFRYYISDDGTTTNQLLVYKGKGLNNVAFEKVDDLQIGDEVVVYGGLTTYNNASEVASGNYISSLIRPEKPKHFAKFYVNGEELTTAQVEVSEGEAITFPAEIPADINGKTFVGWTAGEIEGEQDEAPTMVTSATMSSDDLNFYAVFATQVGGGGSTTITDELTLETTGVSGTSYTEWTGKTATSDAVYAGQSASGNSAIQLRSNNSNSGVISTTSGGQISKVSVAWNENTADGRTINIYGSNTAYTAATDLYGENAGTLLGTIVNGTSTELTINGDYAYVGIRSANNALYLDKISIDWTTGAPATYSGYCTTVQAPQPVTVTLNKYGYATLYYSDKAFIVPEDVTATTYNESVEVSTTYEAGDVIPANEAVVLQGTANAEVSFVVTTTTEKRDENNALKGLDEAGTTVGDGKFYMLSAKNGKVGFYYGADEGAAFETTAHKAYLVIPASKAKEAYYLNDEVTGIQKIDNTLFSTDKIYNLNGQRVDKNYKGVVIVNGKKMINK